MYGKLFTQMYDGSLGTEGPWQALVTFQQMVILADKDGVVDMTAEAIARRTSIPLEVIVPGIDALLKPDPRSRSTDEDGRRLLPLAPHRNWGWRIVNYLKYRKIRSADERREYLRQAQAAHRERRRAVNNPSTTVNASTESTQSQPIAVSSKQKALTTKSKAKPKAPASPAPVSLDLPSWLNKGDWQAFIDHRRAIRKPMTTEAQRRAVIRLGKLKREGHDPSKILDISIVSGWQGLFTSNETKAGLDLEALMAEYAAKGASHAH